MMNKVLFYTKTIFLGSIIFTFLGILGPVLMACGLLLPIAGLVKLFGFVFDIDMPFLVMGFGGISIHPIIGVALSFIIGIFLFFIGKQCWKLLIKYKDNIVEEKKLIGNK